MTGNSTTWQRIIEGDATELKGLYLRLLPRVEQWILQNQGTKQDAYDIFHDALTSVIKGGNREETPENAEGFIFQVCKFKWIDILRRLKTENKYRSEVISSFNSRQEIETSTLNKIIDQETSSTRYTVLEESFQLISEICQQLLSLMRAGKKAAEICQIMDFNQVSTVHRRKFACMEAWKKEAQRHPLYEQSLKG